MVMEILCVVMETHVCGEGPVWRCMCGDGGLCVGDGDPVRGYGDPYICRSFNYFQRVRVADPGLWSGHLHL